MWFKISVQTGYKHCNVNSKGGRRRWGTCISRRVREYQAHSIKFPRRVLNVIVAIIKSPLNPLSTRDENS